MPSVAVELHARFITRMSVAEVGESSQLLQYSLREVQGRPWTVLRSTVSREGGGLKVSVALGSFGPGLRIRPHRNKGRCPLAESSDLKRLAIEDLKTHEFDIWLGVMIKCTWAQA